MISPRYHLSLPYWFSGGRKLVPTTITAPRPGRSCSVLDSPGKGAPRPLPAMSQCWDMSQTLGQGGFDLQDTLWLCQVIAIENDPVEIVEFPINSMVDLSIATLT